MNRVIKQNENSAGAMASNGINVLILLGCIVIQQTLCTPLGTTLYHT